MNLTGVIGLAFILLFLILILIFSALGRKRPGPPLREIPAFAMLGRSIGLAVESGSRLHVTLGWGGVNGPQLASALVGLSILEKITRSASVSDCPPVATSGEATLSILTQDTIRSSFRASRAQSQYDPGYGRLSGLTPLSYAAGVLPVITDEQVSATLLAGHFGSEVALLTDAAERTRSLTLSGSDSLVAQAVMVAASSHPLIGEELYAASAYLKSGPVPAASLRAQDIMRWVLVTAIIAGAALKFLGLL